MGASSNPCILTVSRDLIEEVKKNPKKVVVKLTTFLKKAVLKIKVDRRLKSFHF